MQVEGGCVMGTSLNGLQFCSVLIGEQAGLHLSLSVLYSTIVHDVCNVGPHLPRRVRSWPDLWSWRSCRAWWRTWRPPSTQRARPSWTSGSMWRTCATPSWGRSPRKVGNTHTYHAGTRTHVQTLHMQAHTHYTCRHTHTTQAHVHTHYTCRHTQTT